jgi:8-oxo-dGTP pyrophosphatase MutT (NUDIX family)
MGTDYRHRYIAPVSPAEVPDPPVRPASTVIVTRPSVSGFDVLTVRRGDAAPFMGNARVFPGGVVREGAEEERPWRAAALRELAEEAGVFLTDPPGTVAAGSDTALYGNLAAAGGRFDAGALVYLSNWVTPRGLSRRFDTRFYVASVTAQTRAAADGIEVFEAEWLPPAEVLARADAGEWHLEMPTRAHVELLAGFHDCADLLNYAARQRPVRCIRPRILVADDGSWRVVMPDEPGYEEAMR